MNAVQPSTMERKHPSLVRDTGGVTYVEYIVVVGFVTLVGAAAVVAVGVPLLKTFRYAQLVLAMPLP